MKITEVRTRVVEWEGATVPLPPHFCTNPMDLVSFGDASMGNFAFHGWVLVEIFTDTGLVGLGNAALSPRVTKDADRYVSEAAADWGRSVGHGISVAADVPADDGVRAQGRGDGRRSRRWILRCGTCWARMRSSRCIGCWVGARRSSIPVYASRLYAMPIPELRVEAQKYKDEGYKAMKLRFGWGPIDGAAGMQKNVELMRNVREVIGDGVDLMADAYMGWTLDYAKRMLPLIEPFHLRWLEEPVIPDDTRGYKELKSYGRVPIAGGEHEFTIFGFRDLLEANALDYIQFDTNRVGGISQARKISALAESFQVPVVPHAGQMHNYHVVMASLNSPIAEFFPQGGCRGGERIVLVHLRWRAGADGWVYRSGRQHAGAGTDGE